MKGHAYSYVVLQYRHDVWIGEALNLGVLVCCPGERVLKLRSRRGRGRIAQAYPGIDAPALTGTLKALEHRFSKIESSWDMLSSAAKAGDIGRGVLRADASSLQWALDGGGITSSSAETVDMLYERFVGRYDDDAPRDTRSDEQVFETVKVKLEAAQLYKRFERHVVRSEFGDVPFEHALKNGVWHCVQGVSFDSANRDRMLEKAQRLAGKMHSIAGFEGTMRPYFVTGKPQRSELLPQYGKMQALLRSSPLSPLVVDEVEASVVVDRIAAAAH
ncbi:DUF3037 domain-containing protein [Mangrovicoccus sp. HB161399]|uniref:DUF3037 domain-containing protein n=1 Tax=Mangrovicoccus sp. HB161399 TaxID=2720392 RepID=UPI001552DF3F|nr:DUF3037 domain-containing protein [Mangrovicoccus sp. HB161399]